MTTKLQVKNPGAEEGIEHWLSESNYGSIRDGNPSPHSGSSYFFGGEHGESELFQDIDVSEYAEAIDTGSVEAEVRYWASSFDESDEGDVRLKVYNDGGVLLDEQPQELFAAPGQTWKSYRRSMVLPQWTRTIRIQMDFVKHSGSKSNFHVDDIELHLLSFSTLDGVLLDDSDEPIQREILFYRIPSMEFLASTQSDPSTGEYSVTFSADLNAQILRIIKAKNGEMRKDRLDRFVVT